MEDLDTRPFPIQGGVKREENGEVARPIVHDKASSIPWWLAEEAYAYYASRFGKQQTLDRLAERGGFGRKELLMLLRREL